jgi:hypothetical protein
MPIGRNSGARWPRAQLKAGEAQMPSSPSKEELYKAQKQQICLAILEGKTEQVQKILGKEFVPDSEVLNVAAGANSVQFLSLSPMQALSRMMIL